MRRIILVFLAAISLTSCMDEGDGSYSLDKMWMSLGIVNKGAGDSFTVKLDNGTVLYPVVSNVQSSKLEDGGRVLVNYTILSNKVVTDSLKEYYVRINSVRKILMKGILDITPAIEDSIGNDPVKVEDIWVSKNQLLNIEISYLGNYKMHYINLVKEPGKLTSADQPIQLELRHNDNGDGRDYPMTALVTFELDAIKIQGLDSVRFEVKSIDYNNKSHTFNGVYHYHP